MGCLGCSGVDVDLTIDGLDEMLKDLPAELTEIELKYPDDKLQEKKEEVLKKRHEELEKVDKKVERLVISMVKDFNDQELKIDNELIKIKLDKLHDQYELGLKTALKAKNKLIEKLEQQIEKASSLAKEILSKKINEIKSMTPAEFLESEFGKPIKDALEKQGISQTGLKSYKDDLRNQRAERRKKEREEFDIKQNEWPEEEMFDDDKENLYQKMLDEFKDKKDF